MWEHLLHRYIDNPRPLTEQREILYVRRTKNVVTFPTVAYTINKYQFYPKQCQWMAINNTAQRLKLPIVMIPLTNVNSKTKILIPYCDTVMGIPSGLEKATP